MRQAPLRFVWSTTNDKATLLGEHSAMLKDVKDVIAHSRSTRVKPARSKRFRLTGSDCFPLGSVNLARPSVKIVFKIYLPAARCVPVHSTGSISETAHPL